MLQNINKYKITCERFHDCIPLKAGGGGLNVICTLITKWLHFFLILYFATYRCYHPCLLFRKEYDAKIAKKSAIDKVKNMTVRSIMFIIIHAVPLDN